MIKDKELNDYDPLMDEWYHNPHKPTMPKRQYDALMEEFADETDT